MQETKNDYDRARIRKRCVGTELPEIDWETANGAISRDILVEALAEGWDEIM